MESNNKNTEKFEEVVVVEGRDDTKRLKLFFPEIETIETNGSEISEETLLKIKKVAESRPVIILTDPDFNGERIRRKVAEVVPKAKQAFLKRADAVPSKSHGSLGVEHASRETLEHALNNLHERVLGEVNETEQISHEFLLERGLIVGLDARKKRDFVGQQLEIGYANAKQFERRLVTFGITKTQLAEVLKKWETR